MYGHVTWLNATDGLSKPKAKSTDLVSTLFLFKTCIVLLAIEKMKGKRKPKVLLQC